MKDNTSATSLQVRNPNTMGFLPALRTSFRTAPGALFSGLLSVFWGLRIWAGGAVIFPWVSVLSALFVLLGLATVVLAITKRRVPSLVLVNLLVALGGLFIWTYLQVYTSPSYGTDEIAFDQYAAQLFLHGINPYVTSMRPAFQEFLVPTIFHTYTLTGHTVTTLSYPALSFLFYVPVLLMGIHAQAAVYVDIVAWGVTAILLYRLLPSSWKWLSVLVVSFLLFDSYFVGGVTDALFLPFLVLALWRWDRFANPHEKSIARWIGPVAMGLAMSVKQTPWFFVPFVVMGLVMEYGWNWMAWKIAWRYTAITGGVFLLTNLPFVLMNFSAWIHDILLPLTAHTVPAGQGLVDLAYYDHLGGGNLEWYSLAGAFFVLLVFATFLLFYKPWKTLWPAVIPLMFFWPTRSFGSYLIDLFPAIVIALFSVSRSKPTPSRFQIGSPWLKMSIIFALLTGFLVGAILSIATPAPLAIKVVKEQSTGQFSTLDKISLQVTNRTSQPVQPHITVTSSGRPYITTFWNAIGPTSIKPHAMAHFTIVAPNVQSMPSIGAGVRIVAFTTHPAALSVSALSLPDILHTVLEPAAFNKPEPLNHLVKLHVQLRNRMGSRIDRSGIRIALGQIIYGQSHLIPAQTQISGHPEGQTPVMARTNAQGVATFTVKALQWQDSPIYYQAFIDQHGHFPYGYSNVVIINFHQAKS